MSRERLLRHRMKLSRPTRSLDSDGDEIETLRPVANDVACLFDRWDAAAVETAGRGDVRRRARLFLASAVVRAGDRVEVEGGTWRAVRTETIPGPAASLVLVELAAGDAGEGHP